MPIRRAKVFSKNDIAGYLPSRYKVIERTAEYSIIEGEDFRGWTLDDYIIPRLASGMLHCEEIE